MSKEKLKPCPFCGEEIRKEISPNEVGEWIFWHVCESTRLLIAQTYVTKKEAIKAWNRRAK